MEYYVVCVQDVNILPQGKKCSHSCIIAGLKQIETGLTKRRLYDRQIT